MRTKNRQCTDHRTWSRVAGRSYRIAAAAAGLCSVWLTAAPAAYASECMIEDMTHYGSTVLFEQCDGGITISYAKPRKAIATEGAKTGSLLFRGKVGAGGAITGTATTFKAGCPDEVFPVSGTVSLKRGSVRSLVVSGSAPVRNASCAVISRKTVKLIFER